MKRCQREVREHHYPMGPCDKPAAIVFIDDRDMREVALCAKHAGERQVRRYAERMGLRVEAAS